MVGVLLALAGASASRADDSLTNAQLLTNTETVLFGSEFISPKVPVIRRWTGPLRLAVYGDEVGRYTDIIDAHLTDLRRLTGLDIARVDSDDSTQNARLLFLGPSQFRTYVEARLPPAKSPNLVSSLACFGLFSFNARSEITSISAVIPTALSRSQIQACVVEELTQVLGLPNDSFEIRPSIFNDNEEFQALTWQDEIMIRLLYDRRVRPGMSRVQFEAVGRKVLEEMRPGD